jgi:phage gpG-like protein
MLNVSLVGDKEVIAKLTAMPNKVKASLERKVTALAYQLLAKVKGKLSGEVLKVRSGLLRDSAFERVLSTATSVTGQVVEPGSVPYAAIHEFGGTINVPEIVPVKAKALMFQAGGATVFAARTRAHTVTMPERSYMRSSLADMEQQIREGLNEAVREGLALR